MPRVLEDANDACESKRRNLGIAPRTPCNRVGHKPEMRSSFVCARGVRWLCAAMAVPQRPSGRIRGSARKARSLLHFRTLWSGRLRSRSSIRERRLIDHEGHIIARRRRGRGPDSKLRLGRPMSSTERSGPRPPSPQRSGRSSGGARTWPWTAPRCPCERRRSHRERQSYARSDLWHAGRRTPGPSRDL